MFKRIKQYFCSHHLYLSSVRRMADGNVCANCIKCSKWLTAPYGLALKAKFVHEEKP